MKIAVLGGGHGGYAAAADLTLRGYEVCLFTFSAARVETLHNNDNVISYTGVWGEGSCRVAHVSNSMEEAVSGADLDAQSVVPPGGKSARSVAPGVKVHVHQLHPHRSADVQLCQRVPGRELQLKQMPRRPAKGVRLAFGRAGGVQIGQHGVPHMELCALAGDRIVLGPDVQPQGVGAHQRPGVQLGAAPCKCLPCATQSKGEKQAKAEQSHLRTCKHSG